MSNEVTITIRASIPGDHPFLNMQAIADDVASRAFVQIEGLQVDHGVAYENPSVTTHVVEVTPAHPSNPLAWPHFDVPEWLWEDNGEDDDPSARLNTAVYINSIPMHLEAFAVGDKTADDFQPIVPASYGEGLYSGLVEHHGFPGEPMYEHTIRGRHYVVVASPFFD